MKLWNSIPVILKSLFLRLGIIMIFLSITRLAFYIFNSDAFVSVRFADWFYGFWFDLVTVSLVFLPFIVFSLLPLHWQAWKLVRILKVLSFLIPAILLIALNLLDTAYFAFTLKRSTADLFAIVSAGNDIGQLLTSFIADYWHLIIISILLILGLLFLYRKTDFKSLKSSRTLGIKTHIAVFVTILAVFVVIGRGGFGLRPISPIDATLYTKPENAALVLNSTFTILKSIGKDDLQEVNYFSQKELDKLFQPIRKSHPQHSLPNKTNVMIVMLESFGNEWVGKFNGGNTYTPFLDSILDNSWYFEYGISNGKKSIEAVPAISASLPTLMDNPYISSAYSNNQLQSLPNVLAKFGYSSGFYHGATNGSMRFNSFALQIGYQQYVGRFEYNNDKHFDKTWGILDEYFNPWTAKQLTKLKEPFVANLFTLSSHHPYFVPQEWRHKVKKGPNPICKSISYGDISLRKFFEQAKKEPWYDHTLFVLVADHTSSTQSKLYGQRTEMYQIPIAFFDPSGKLPRKREQAIFQHIDIMPTVLDLLNIQTTYYSFGNSFFSNQPREAITYLEGAYYYFYDHFMLVYSSDKVTGLYDFTKKKINPENCLNSHKNKAREMAKRLKAIIQRYNYDLIHNLTVVR